MLASEIITAARDISNLSVAQKSDALILPYLNMANKKLTQEVNSFLSEDSYSNIFTGDLVAGQEEYTIPKITATDDGAFSVSGVSVNYAPQVLQLGTATFTTGSNVVTGVNTTFGCKPGTMIVAGAYAYEVSLIVSATSLRLTGPAKADFTGAFYIQEGNWRRCTQFRLGNRDPEFLRMKYLQPFDTPFVSLFDTGAFLAPVPTADLIGSLRFYATRDPMPLALTDSPLLSPDLDYALIDALAVWMYKIRNMFNEAQAQMNFADKSKQDAIVMLQNRFVVPKVQEEINLTRFE